MSVGAQTRIGLLGVVLHEVPEALTQRWEYEAVLAWRSGNGFSINVKESSSIIVVPQAVTLAS